MEILYKELSYRIIGCVFNVFSEIGPGYDEPTYHQGLMVSFERQGLKFLSKPHFILHYRGTQIAELEPDYIIDDKIILEIKAIQSDFLPTNYKQIISYLRITNKRLGILINMGLLRAGFDRVPYDERPLKIVDDFENINPIMNDHEEEVRRLHDAIVNVAKELGVGYHTEIYQEAMKVELEFGNFTCDAHVKVPVYYQNVFIKNYEIDYWLVNQKILLAVLAGSKEASAYDIVRMRSYLRGLNLKLGLIAFWGKDHLKIVGVSPQQ
ncbi:MAG: GxxExxY protein [candidate division KSB1 bacterium]|nr:GxxExxY protein [candidate division KSB1 bacterium]MDZ7368080.1 GxxExxY protein [candidate division KSB1 bacterium]MDZ7405694.1 GxxExxY protein [candidate division KSB1 bacterium]